MIYAGSNGHYELFEDDGITNKFKKGIFATIPVTYEEEGRISVKLFCIKLKENMRKLKQ